MERLQELLDYLGDEPWLRAGTALVLAIIAAYLIDWIMTRVLKTITRRTATDADDQLLALFHKPVRTTVFLCGLWIAAKQLHLDEINPVVHPQDGLIHVWEGRISSVLKTICLLVWTVFAFRFSKLMLRVLSKDTRRLQVIEPATLPLFDNLFKVLLFGFSVYLLVKAWGGDVQGLLASAGVMGLAIGFAAKDTLSNLFAGVFIIADAPYRLGDFIVLDSGERGMVNHIGLRSTRLMTRDDIEITIPNSVMGSAKILNETGGLNSKRRLKIKVGVAYGSDIDLVRQVLVDVAKQSSDVCANPEPRVRFRNFGDSTLDFELLVWISEPVLRGRATDALNCAVYKNFADKGIEIAFPQLDVHVHKVS
jgi:MscS family membrane protein